jgi:uncharacterized membrane protein YqaE (UPF0057 family)
MKKISKMTALFALSVVVLASCTVQKRLHNPGFHVQFDKKFKNEKFNVAKKTSEKNTVIAVENNTNQTFENNQVEALKELVVANEVANTVITETVNDVAAVENTVVAPVQKTAKKVVSTTQKTVTQSVTKKQTSIAKLLTKTKANSASGSGKASGGTLVLFVILCLFPFINLIPVYLTDGSITMNFWVTLILDILGALPGIIFALLVVLGVVSL